MIGTRCVEKSSCHFALSAPDHVVLTWSGLHGNCILVREVTTTAGWLSLQGPQAWFAIPVPGFKRLKQLKVRRSFWVMLGCAIHREQRSSAHTARISCAHRIWISCPHRIQNICAHRGMVGGLEVGMCSASKQTSTLWGGDVGVGMGRGCITIITNATGNSSTAAGLLQADVFLGI